jgi:hypothetical protein
MYSIRLTWEPSYRSSIVLLHPLLLPLVPLLPLLLHLRPLLLLLLRWRPMHSSQVPCLLH